MMKKIALLPEAVGIINRIRKDGPYVEIWMTGRVEWHQRCKARQLESLVNRSGLTDRVLNLGLAGLEIGWTWLDVCRLDPVSLREPDMAEVSLSVQFVRKSTNSAPWEAGLRLEDCRQPLEQERPAEASSSRWGMQEALRSETVLFRREVRTTDFPVRVS